MLTRLSAGYVILALSGLMPLTVLAADLWEYPLTQEQRLYIEEMALAIEVPEGEVPVIQRCDTNMDGAVDITDIRAISRKRNQPAAHPDDPMDWDKNSVINLLDARGCQQACTLPRCAVSTTPPPPSAPPAGVVEDASCFQTADIDGDGEEDFAGIFEHTGGPTRGGDWTLEVVILNKDENGNVQHITYPYSGQRSTENGGELHQHLSLQPAGMVDLAPGTLMIDEPAVVSYRNGEPKTIYYHQDGILNRAFYGIND